MNLSSFAYKSSINKTKALGITGEMEKALERLVQELIEEDKLSTVYECHLTEYWLIGKKGNGRLLFMIAPKGEKTSAQMEGKRCPPFIPKRQCLLTYR